MRAVDITMMVLVGGTMLFFLIGAAWSGLSELRDARDEKNARWSTWQECDPRTGKWVGGIRLLTSRGVELERVEMYRLSAAVSVSDRLEADASAMQRADNVNESRQRESS